MKLLVFVISGICVIGLALFIGYMPSSSFRCPPNHNGLTDIDTFMNWISINTTRCDCGRIRHSIHSSLIECEIERKSPCLK